MFERNTFCTGSAFVAKQGGVEEDDGWIITFVHNEDTNISQVGLSASTIYIYIYIFVTSPCMFIYMLSFILINFAGLCD